MEKLESTEALFAWIVDFFAEKFGNSAILKEKMILLWNLCRCLTQLDLLDYRSE